MFKYLSKETGKIIFITKENVNDIEHYLYLLSMNNIRFIDGIYCPNCYERTRFKYTDIFASCCGEHTGVECTNCRKQYDSVSNCMYNSIQEYNKIRFRGFSEI